MEVGGVMTKDEGKMAKRELPERWSAQQKTEVVLGLLRGEDLGEISREIQVPAHEIEQWRRVILESGTTGCGNRGPIRTSGI